MGTKWCCLILTCFFQALGLSRHGHVPRIHCRTARLAASLSHVCSTAWWVFSASSFSSGGGLQACLLYMVPFWKSQLFFFVFENHSVSWAVPLQHSIAEWLRWQRPYEDHLILPPSVFSFKAQCRCSKSAEKWACKTVMTPAYLILILCFQWVMWGTCAHFPWSHSVLVWSAITPFTLYYSVHTPLPSISIFIHPVFQNILGLLPAQALKIKDNFI